MVMVLAFGTFATNLYGFVNVVRAEDFGEEQLMEEGPAAEQPGEDPDAAAAAAEAAAAQQAAEEEAARQAAEAAAAAQQAAEEEAARQAEAEAAAAAAAAQQAEAEAEAQRIAAEQEEAARQAALEEAARQAQEEAEQQKQEDEAAKKALELAEAEAKAAEEAKAAAAAAQQKAEEEAAKQGQYSLLAYKNGNVIKGYDFGKLQVGNDAEYTFEVVNNGLTKVDLIYGLTNVSDGGVFNLICMGDTTLYFAGGDQVSTWFRVRVSPYVPAGKYSAVMYFADASDPSCKKGLKLNLSVTVTGSSSRITGVSVTPAIATLSVGNSYEFYSYVSGEGAYDSSVNWGVSGNMNPDTGIDKNGILYVSQNETANNLTVVCSSVQDPTVKGYSSIQLQRNSYNVNVSANPKNGGIVTGGGAVKEGGSVTLSAVPNKNFAFTGWVRDGKVVSTQTNYTINNVRCNINVTAGFRQNYVTVNAVPNDSNFGSVVGGGNITYGGKTVLSAKANNGYVFLYWKEGDSRISDSASLELTNLTYNRNIIGVFGSTTRKVTIGVNIAEGGTVSGQGTYNVGSDVIISAREAAGYSFDSWTVNGQVVSRSRDYTIKEIRDDYCFVANFIKSGLAAYAISSGVATTGGTITPSGITMVAAGQGVTYTITPKTGFAILAVAVDGIQVGPVGAYTFSNVNTPHTIAAAFVQTDAGKKAAEASGQSVQRVKVQTIEKTNENTATKETIIDLTEANDGSAGDEFVEEMDLTEITIPTDEELGITEDQFMEEVPETLRNLGLTRDEAAIMIANGDVASIIDEVFYEGRLDAHVDNQLERKLVLPDFHQMSREELMNLTDDDVINPSVPNIDRVVINALNSSEVFEIVDGGTASVTVSLTKTAADQVDKTVKKIMDSRADQKPLQYFDLTMMKLVNGSSENVTSLSEPMQVVIEIPDEIYKKGKVYSVLRLHNGELSILPDIDDDEKTITFNTDRFSSYAIAEQIGTSRDMAIRFAVGALIALIVALACLVILLVHQTRMIREKKKARK